MAQYTIPLHHTMSKYGSRKVTIDNIIFDSQKEAKRYSELKLLLKAHAISNLQIHERILLQQGFYYKQQRQLPIYYEADFIYYENGKRIIEDTKGFRTKEYMMKKKLLLFHYPHIEFREV